MNMCTSNNHNTKHNRIEKERYHYQRFNEFDTACLSDPQKIKRGPHFATPPYYRVRRVLTKTRLQIMEASHLYPRYHCRISTSLTRLRGDFWIVSYFRFNFTFNFTCIFSLLVYAVPSISFHQSFILLSSTYCICSRKCRHTLECFLHRKAADIHLIGIWQQYVEYK